MCTITDEAMSATEIKMWHEHFKDGRESVESDTCSGRPATSRTLENVEHVSKDCNQQRLATVSVTTGS